MVTIPPKKAYMTTEKDKDKSRLEGPAILIK
jgi:hypothetical protein